MFQHAIPVLHVDSIEKAKQFYIKTLGFEQMFAYQPFKSQADPCYVGLRRDHAIIHISSFSGDGVSGGVVYLMVESVDQLFEELTRQKTLPAMEPVDQTWGNREMYIEDPDGNSIRFVQEMEG